MPKGRWLAVLAVALVSFGALAVAKGGEKGPVPVAQSDCYACHAGDAIPMEAMAGMRPPGEFTLRADGTTTEYGITIANAWIQDPGKLHFVNLAATLDISKAPSLRFVAADPDIEDLPADVRIEADPAALTSPRSGAATYDVPIGASTLEFRIEPEAAEVPYRFVVVPPGGQPVAVDVAAGEGASYAHPDPVVPAGNWSVGAEVVFLRPGASPGLATEASFTTYQTVRFADAQLRAKTLSKSVAPEESVLAQPVLLTWNLAADATPGADETVLLRTNTTAYYDHTATPPTGDWGNFTEEVEMRVEPSGDRVAIVPGTIVVGRPQPINGPTIVTVSEAIGYASAFLLLSSIVSGGMLGKASRRGMNAVFGSAKRRVAFHNVLSYGIILAAAVHTVLFIVESFYNWTLGLIWGGIAMLCMLGLGVTGAVQIPMIRRWSYGVWRWWHYGLTVGVLVFTVVHGLLDGVHFGELQDAIGWSDPLDPAIKA